MARIRNIVMEGATGRLGSMVLTQRAGTGTVARTLAPEVTNPKSDAQQTRRVKWANLVNFYKVSKGWMAKAFENKKSNQSDYNKFMSLNANTTQVALTKDQASQGGVIAGPYTISQGSLPSVEITKLSGGAYATNIALGNFVISAATTVAEFSAAVLDNNAQLKEGYQISFISYQQASNAVTGVPYVVCGWYEVTLNRTDTRILNTVMPISFAAASVDNSGKYLGTGAALSSGSFAYVISTRQGGKILVSTQQLTVHDNSAYNQAITSAALAAAIASYGQSTEVFLAPGYAGGGQTQTATNSIVSVTMGSRTANVGAYLGAQPSTLFESQAPYAFVFESDLDPEVSVTSIVGRCDNGAEFTMTANGTVNGNRYSGSNSVSASREASPIVFLSLTFANGKQYNASFKDQSGTIVD